MIVDKKLPENQFPALIMSDQISEKGSEKRAVGKLPQTIGERPSELKNSVHEIAVIFVCCLGPALGNFNAGIFQLALPYVGDSFGLSGGILTWSIAAFTLANGSTLLFSGGLADAFGRKRLLMFSFFFYSLFTLISGFIHNFVWFCILRALQGAAASAAVPASVGVLSSLYSKHNVRRNRVMATFAGGAPLGYISSIIVAGVCCEVSSWRAVLFFMTVVYLLVTVLAYFVVPNDEPLNFAILKEKLKIMDYVGVFLGLCGLTLLTFPLTQADAAPEGWKTPYITGLLVASIVILAIFCIYETYVPKKPLLPMTIWKYPGFGLCMFIVSCGWMMFQGIMVFYMALYFQNIRKTSPLLTTAYFLPMGCTGIFVNMFAAFALHRISGRVLLIVGMACYLVGGIMWSVVPLHAAYYGIPLFSMFLVTIGADLSYNVGTMHSLNSVSKEYHSTAGGLFNTNLQISTTIGLAAASAIVTSITPDQINASPALLLRAYHGAFYLSVGIGFAGLVASFFLKIGTQGHETEVHDEESDFSVDSADASILETGSAVVIEESIDKEKEYEQEPEKEKETLKQNENDEINA